MCGIYIPHGSSSPYHVYSAHFSLRIHLLNKSEIPTHSWPMLLPSWPHTKWPCVRTPSTKCSCPSRKPLCLSFSLLEIIRHSLIVHCLAPERINSFLSLRGRLNGFLYYPIQSWMVKSWQSDSPGKQWHMRYSNCVNYGIYYCLNLLGLLEEDTVLQTQCLMKNRNLVFTVQEALCPHMVMSAHKFLWVSFIKPLTWLMRALVPWPNQFPRHPPKEDWNFDISILDKDCSCHSTWHST